MFEMSRLPMWRAAASAKRIENPSACLAPRGARYQADAANTGRAQSRRSRTRTSSQSRGRCMAITNLASTSARARAATAGLWVSCLVSNSDVPNPVRATLAPLPWGRTISCAGGAAGAGVSDGSLIGGSSPCLWHGENAGSLYVGLPSDLAIVGLDRLGCAIHHEGAELILQLVGVGLGPCDHGQRVLELHRERVGGARARDDGAGVPLHLRG